jgi:transcriptional regulator with XRE-family HTH domain
MVEQMTPVGANVKRLREAAGISQQKLAVEAGLSVGVVAIIEQGRNADPRGSTLRALARVLGTTIDDLLRDPADAPGEEAKAEASSIPKKPRRGKGKGK